MRHSVSSVRALLAVCLLAGAVPAWSYTPGSGTIYSTNFEAIDADAVLLVAPAQHVRAVTGAVAAGWPGRGPAGNCAKGIGRGSPALVRKRWMIPGV